jgi:GTP cyclohydrolase II
MIEIISGHHGAFDDDLRRYDVAAEMLRALGVRSVALVTNNPQKVDGLRAAGVEVSARVPLVTEAHAVNAQYLETKRLRMGHLYPPSAVPASALPASALPAHATAPPDEPT